MQGKGAIKFFAIALAIACIYSLSFTVVSYFVEKDAKAYANGDVAKEKAYLDSMSSEVVLNLGVSKFTYQQCKQLQINLGLDLKGGMNVTMEIELADLIKSLSGNNSDSTLNSAILLANKRQITSQKDYITLFGEAFTELKPNGKLAPLFATTANKNSINYNSSNSEVLSFLKKESESAIDRSFNILRTRIDKFGVSQPNIQLQEGSNRVVIELPGVDDPQRVRKLLQGSAKLEFWQTFQNAEVYPILENINRIVSSKLKLKGENTDSTVTATVSTDSTKENKSKENSLIAKINKAKSDSTTADTSSADQQKLKSENPLFSVLSPSFYVNQEGQQMLTPGATVGIALVKDTAKVNEYLNYPEVRSSIPSDLKFHWGVKAMNDKGVFELYALRASGRESAPVLEGDVISDARSDYDQNGNPEVIMVMNTEGSKIWKKITAEAAADPNNKKSVAIVLDNAVYSAPTVQNEISGGVSSITGNFKVEETKDLANVLKAGKLPAPAKIVEEAIVGPSLGQEAISAGLISAVLGLVLVLLFIIFYYNSAGVIATLALFINMFFIFGVLASLGAVLTLPGIAGIVLTIGISVDANVLIYERIREELDLGKNLKLAVADGFKHAFSTVVDSNVVTLLTAIVLYVFGSGPVQGFATTLIIGILSSMFCAIFITRLMIEWAIAKEKNLKFSIPFTANTFKNAHFKFVGNRKYYYMFSTLVIVAGIISMSIRGLNYGVDFKGGRTYVVRFENSVSTESIREVLSKEFGSAPEVKTFGGDNQIKITTSYLINDPGTEVDTKVQDAILGGLKTLNNPAEILSSQKVGPTIANDIKVSALYSILIALVIIFFYIAIRFRKWQYSIGAIVALAHDVLMVLSFFSLMNGLLPFPLDIDQHFIAAVLTVVGYSITDTVVVFDRIREYLNLHHSKKDDMKTVINDAINSTLSRTVITSLTVLFVLTILFVFGGEVIKGFSFALLVGVAFGTYSSVCIATPVMVDLVKTKKKE